MTHSLAILVKRYIKTYVTSGLWLMMLSLAATVVSILILEGTRYLYDLAIGLAEFQDRSKILADSVVFRWLWHWYPSWIGMAILLCLAVLALVALQKLLGGIQSAYSYIVGHRMVQDVQIEMTQHLLRVPLAYFKGQDTGSVVKKVLTDAQGLQALIITVIVENITRIFTLTGIFGYLFYLDWRLALCSMALIPLYLFVMFPIGKRLQASAERCNQILGELSGHLEEIFAGVETIKSNQAFTWEIARFQKVTSRHYLAKCTWSVHQTILSSLIALVQEGCPVMALGVGVYLVLQNELTAGTLPVFLAATRMIFPPLGSLAMGYANYLNLLTFLNKIMEVLDTPLAAIEQAAPLPTHAQTASAADGAASGKHLPIATPCLEFAHVGYCYPDKRFQVSDLNFTVVPGEIVMICGETGAGKSTLFHLACRILEGGAGTIRVLGKPLSDLTSQDLQRCVGYMIQKPFCFRRTLRDNIIYGSPDTIPTDAEILHLARQIGFEDDIFGLAQGLDTQLARRGENLSGGQQQMVGLMRVLLQKRPLLLLDEPLAALSPQLRQNLIAKLPEILQGRAAVIISHNLELSVVAHKILRFARRPSESRVAELKAREKQKILTVAEQQELAQPITGYLES